METENKDIIETDDDTILKSKKGRPKRVKSEEEINIEIEKQQIKEAKQEVKQKKQITKQLKTEYLEQGEIYRDTDEANKPPREKRVVSQKTLDALALGREKSKEVLAKKYEIQRQNKKEATEQLVIKKANRIIELELKHKNKIKKDLDLDDVDDEYEELIQVIQPIKAKKKKIILTPESDSEEEVVYKKKSKATKLAPIPLQVDKTTIKFY